MSWQTLSIHERKAQLPAKMKKYENMSVEDMAKEFGVKDEQLKEIEKAVEKPTISIEEDIPAL